jgi:plastocyanin
MGLAPVAALAAPVEPASVAVTLKPGESTTVNKQVTAPEIPAIPDIYMLADTTGSMGVSVAAAQAGAAAILTDILAIDPDAQFGAGDYKDFPYDPYCFRHQQAITADTALVSSAVSAWSASGGSDGPEGQFYALYKIATDPAIGWRSGTNRIVVWFGDAPGHDPIPAEASPDLTEDITEASLVAALKAARITVVAVSVTSGYPLGLDDDPLMWGGDYESFYTDYVAAGTAGQATRIAAATGGLALADVEPGDLVDAILAGLTDLPTDITATVVADPGLTVTFEPASRTGVAPGTVVDFVETISVASDAETVTVLNATVTFWAGTAPIGEQQIAVTVPAVAPGLPKTGIGPERTFPWQAALLVSFALGLAWTARRRNAATS